MSGEIFVATLAVLYAILLAWGFKTLPAEKWQILASVPRQRMEGESWKGLNLTYYGFFTACAYVMSTAVLFILLGSVLVPVRAIVMLSLIVGALCVPASRLVAAVVEKKSHTATVGGATFVGIIVAPWAIPLANGIFGDVMSFNVDVMNGLSALAVAYSFGEGTGRLACISFGCCYGKPLSQCGPIVGRLFKRFNFVFVGKTKKIAYASGLDGKPVLPVQAMTSVIYVASALVGVYLFMNSRPVSAFLEITIVTQLWRFFSEFLRADYRGGGRFSVYQWMSILGAGYAACIAVVFSGAVLRPEPQISAGLLSLWDPAILVLLQLMWLIMFLLSGRSMVTASVISFHVIRDRV